jgi:hypothetical protein
MGWPLIPYPKTAPGRLVVNLGQAVVEAVREARYLDRLGFAVPDVTLHAALQAGRLRAAAEGLAAMLAAYYKARSCCIKSLVDRVSEQQGCGASCARCCCNACTHAMGDDSAAARGLRQRRALHTVLALLPGLLALSSTTSHA